MTSMSRLCVFGLCLAAAPFGAAMASGGGGGGGGGGFPSSSAPTYDPVQEYRDGMTAYQAGKFKDAARSFDHVTDAAPKDIHGWFMLGMAKAGAGDDKAAARAYDRALKVDPNSIEVRREDALALIRSKQAEKAAAHLAALKARAATCADTCPEAADLKAAVSAVEQGMTGGTPTAWIDRPATLMFAADGDAAYGEAVGLINQHRYGDALAALDRAAAVFGPHPDILTYQGYAWRKLGDIARAESHYKAALAIAPSHRGATEYYGELKVIEGDMKGARVMLAHLDAQCAFGCVEAEDLRHWIELGRDPAS